MRQAGRYMPEYRAVRSRVSFLELCKTPDLACEVTMQPIDAFDLDAAILFCDILIPLEAMGMELLFTEQGPKLPDAVKNRAAIDKLGVPDPEATMPFVMQAIRTIRKALADRIPLIGFAGAPFTMASYAVEGGTSRSFLVLKELMFREPKAAHALLEKLSDTIAIYLEAQIAAGAQAVQLFDTWAGILSPRDFDEFALSYAKRIISKLKASKAVQENRVPIIYFVNGCAPYLEQIRDVGADVIGIDWKIDLAQARKRLGDGVGVQGNLDPAALLLPPEQIALRAQEVLAQAGDAPGHVFNLGHGVFPQIPVDHVRALVKAVKEHG